MTSPLISSSSTPDMSSLTVIVNNLKTQVDKYIQSGGEEYSIPSVIYKKCKRILNKYLEQRTDTSASPSPRSVEEKAIATKKIALIKTLKSSLVLVVEHILQLTSSKINKTIPKEDSKLLFMSVQKGFSQLVNEKKHLLKCKIEKKTIQECMSIIETQDWAKSEAKKERNKEWKEIKKTASENYQNYCNILNKIEIIGFEDPPKDLVLQHWISRTTNHQQNNALTLDLLLKCYRYFMTPQTLFRNIRILIEKRDLCVEQKRSLLLICRKWLRDRTHIKLYGTPELFAEIKKITELTSSDSDDLVKEQSGIISGMVDAAIQKSNTEYPVVKDTVVEAASGNDESSHTTTTGLSWSSPPIYPKKGSEEYDAYLNEMKNAFFFAAARHYEKIKPIEWVTKVDGEEREKYCPNLVKIETLLNKLSCFICHEILMTHAEYVQISEIKNRLSFFVDLCFKCYEEGDIFSFCAIGGSLGRSFIPNAITEHEKENIEKIVTWLTRNARKEIRTHQNSFQKKPCIPYVSLFNYDLETIGEGRNQLNKKKINPLHHSNKQINLNITLLKDIYQIINKTIEFQTSLKNGFYPVTSIEKTVLSMKSFKDEEDLLVHRNSIVFSEIKLSTHLAELGSTLNKMLQTMTKALSELRSPRGNSSDTALDFFEMDFPDSYPKPSSEEFKNLIITSHTPLLHLAANILRSIPLSEWVRFKILFTECDEIQELHDFYPNLCKAIGIFEGLTRLVQREIYCFHLKKIDLEETKTRITFFMKLAIASYEKRNYFVFHSIIKALEQLPDEIMEYEKNELDKLKKLSAQTVQPIRNLTKPCLKIRYAPPYFEFVSAFVIPQAPTMTLKKERKSITPFSGSLSISGLMDNISKMNSIYQLETTKTAFEEWQKLDSPLKLIGKHCQETNKLEKLLLDLANADEFAKKLAKKKELLGTALVQKSQQKSQTSSVPDLSELTSIPKSRSCDNSRSLIQRSGQIVAKRIPSLKRNDTTKFT